MLIAKYEYPTLQRKTQTNGKRQYVGDDSIPVPSVTTVLSETGDKTALINWRKRVGDAEANRVSQEAAGLGTKVHNALEKFVLVEDYEIKGNNVVSVMARDMLNVMIAKGLSQVDEIWGVEVALLAKGLYAGTSDAVGMFNGVESIIDFKTSSKERQDSYNESYYIQASAYAEMFEERTGIEINQICILVVTSDGVVQEFVKDKKEYVPLIEQTVSEWEMKNEKFKKLEEPVDNLGIVDVVGAPV
jgi:genome maintenance exonuclease 1